jgi:hypothetical protein
MYIDKFLTEYDESLTGEMNIDPLGQLVIWSSWGQDLFTDASLLLPMMSGSIRSTCCTTASSEK